TDSSATGEYYTNSYVGGTNVTIKSKEDTTIKQNRLLRTNSTGNRIIAKILFYAAADIVVDFCCSLSLTCYLLNELNLF
ncbi:MAG: hypothetical protein FWF73_00815, partial [Spirochaetes bacterium]|nr:hypothetical protein [Spirochaetota bacterium]